MEKVEVIYATLESQELIEVYLSESDTVESCINKSGVLDSFPEIDLSINKVGIFSQVKPLSHPVKSGDRIEIYRVLIADPKEVRRKKAQAAKTPKKA